MRRKMSEDQSRPRARRRRGQALTEFALTFGIFMLVVGAIIQFGLLLWTMNTIHQIARDTARWEATQPSAPCESATNRAAVASRSDTLAGQWSLMGYPRGTWTSAVDVDAVGPSGVGVSWTGGTFVNDCPPSDNQTPWFVHIRINHTVPIFFPGLQILAPTCGSSGFCITTTTEVRMEPKAP
jgi:nitrate reductase NapE component